MDGDTIDTFLFATRRGFCSHYAGATVFLLRSVGIPARIVGGYQGGVSHPIGRYLLVHQYDAHAWVEYWQRGAGWTRVDPTAAVAPFRIEMGPMNPSADISFLTDSPLSPEKFRNSAIFTRLRLMADYVDFLWFKNVVAFDRDQQNSLFKGILGKVTPKRIAMLIAAVGSTVLLLMALVILARREPIKPIDKIDSYYIRFLKKLRKKGVQREAGEGPIDFCNRAAAQLPQSGDYIRNINNLYMRLRYGPALGLESDNDEKQQHASSNGDNMLDIEKQLEAAVKQLKL